MRRVLPQAVAKRQLCPQLLAVGRGDVKVMTTLPLRDAEYLASSDAEVAPVDVTSLSLRRLAHVQNLLRSMAVRRLSKADARAATRSYIGLTNVERGADVASR